MTARARITKLAVVAVCAGAVATSANARDQTLIPYESGNPLTNGCPAGFEALALTDLAPWGYRVPFAIDAAGNGDGIVCGKPLEPQEQEARFPGLDKPIFLFSDNVLVP
jgi:hypothetical protein